MLRPITEILAELRQQLRCIDAKSALTELAVNKGLLIDVREPAEHLVKAALGAINIPRGLIEMKLMEVEKDPARPIYLHCASSARALLSAEQLKRVGYENVSVITCNIDVVISSGL
jgi:phage shock protein E